MGRSGDVIDLGRLALSSGDGRRLDLDVDVESLELAGERYETSSAAVRVDVSRTTGDGWSLRVRSEIRLEGPCMRCLTGAHRSVHLDAREVDQPGAGDDELTSPYVDGDELRLGDWVRDALVLALPAQIVCDDDCRGLCPVCGEDLNRAGPEHRHEAAPDPRWAKLRELRFE
jgi:uncharacterized protein